jgi:RecA/RadA recombinase
MTTPITLPTPQVTETPVKWLLPGIIPLSEVTCITGIPASGKSTFIHWLAAKVSAKKTTLFRGQPIAQGKVVYFCSSGDFSHEIRPCLIENGADTANVLQIASGNILYRYISDVLNRVTERRLIVLDIFSVSADVCDTNEQSITYTMAELYNIQSFSRIINDLRDIARTTETAIVVVTQLPKNNLQLKKFPSLGISPITWLVSEGKTVTNINNKLTEDRQGFLFEIVDGQKNRRVHIINDAA